MHLTLTSDHERLWLEEGFRIGERSTQVADTHAHSCTHALTRTRTRTRTFHTLFCKRAHTHTHSATCARTCTLSLFVCRFEQQGQHDRALQQYEAALSHYQIAEKCKGRTPLFHTPHHTTHIHTPHRTYCATKYTTCKPQHVHTQSHDYLVSVFR